VKVVWGIRSAMNDFGAYDWATRFSELIQRSTSPLADAIVANSHAARRQAVARGMDGEKTVVVPNGIDCARFQPDPAGRERVRREWGVPEDALLVGMVARLDPVKNHGNFLRAAARIAALRGDVRFACVGTGEAAYRQALEQQASGLGLAGRITWAGEQKVTNVVYSALDVAVLASDAGESFPNVVGEAMACGTPCVVTDSGDAPIILGDTGAVVPARDPVALADGILDVLARRRSADVNLPARARARIEREFSVEMLVRRTEQALEKVLAGA
jgi:glycosyltransferase involved in cell wall biosynthesis